MRFSKDRWKPFWRFHGAGGVHGPSRRSGFLLASRRAFQRDRIRIVDQAVEDGVGDRRVAQIGVPLLARQLAGDDRRARRVAVLDDFEQIVALDVGESGQAPVVEDEDVDAGEPREQRRVGAVGAREREFLKEARQAPVDGAVALATRLLAERAGQVGLADAGRAGDQDVAVLDDPATGGELADQARSRSRRGA